MKKNRLLNALYLIIFVSVILFIPSVLAFEFDNVKSYDAVRNEVTITNAFGLGDEIAKAKLDTPQINYVMVGNDRLVARITVDSYTDYPTFIKGMRLIDLRTGKPDTREVTYKYLTYEDNFVQVPDTYVEECIDLKINDTNKEGGKSCTQVVASYKTENQPKEKWMPLEKLDIKTEKIQLGIFTDVYANDNVEWIPTLFGVEIDEWATWTSSFNVGLVSYYGFDESNGVIAQEKVYSKNNITLTSDELINKTNCKNGNCLNINALDNTHNASSATGISTGITQEYTISAWIKNECNGCSGAGQYAIYFGNHRIASNPWTNTNLGEFYVGADATESITQVYFNGSLASAPAMTYNAWHNIVISGGNNTKTRVYIDGINSVNTSVTSIFNNFSSTPLRFYGTASGLNPSKNQAIDELAIWNRSLSQAEITDLASGIYYDPTTANTLTVSLSYPENLKVFTTTSVSFGCNFTSTNQNITNVTLNVTNSTGSNIYSNTIIMSAGVKSYNATWTNTFSDGNYDWNCSASGSLGVDGTSSGSRTLTVHTLSPVINVLYPTSTIDYGYVGQNISLNYSITDLLIGKCWQDYNGTNVTIPCNANSSIILGTRKSINVYANDSVGNLANVSKSWDYGVFETASYVPSNVYETQNIIFYLNITYNGTSTPDVLLNYDNVNHSALNKGSGYNGSYEVNFDIPIISASINKSYYWIINYGSLIIYTTPTNQTINNLILASCNSTYSMTTLNYTIYDETTNVPVDLSSNNLTFKAYFKYWIGSGLIYKNYSYQNISTNKTNFFSYCISPNITIKSDLDLEYSGNNYNERTYYFRNKSISNVTENKILYLLSSTTGTKFFITARQGTDFFANGLISFRKFFTGEGIFKETSTCLTDSNGQCVTYLDLDKNYNFQITKDGNYYNATDRSAICSSTPCTMNLQISGSYLSPFEPFYDYFAQNINYSLNYYPTTKKVVLNFTDLTGTAQYWRLWVYQPNYSSEIPITICDTKVYSVSGSVDCDYSSYNGDIIAKVFISRSPEKEIPFYLFFVNSNVPSILGASGILASIIILIVIIFTGTRNPSIAVMMIPFAFVILKFIGFLPMGWLWICGITIFCLWIADKMNT